MMMKPPKTAMDQFIVTGVTGTAGREEREEDRKDQEDDAEAVDGNAESAHLPGSVSDALASDLLEHE